jgi:hypothetical protein
LEILTYNINERELAEQAKMRSYDRVILLKPMEGKEVISSTGKVDPRLFSGGNKLHAVYNVHTGLWELKVENGSIAGGLQGQFSEFESLMIHVTSYFNRRNIEVVGVID